MNLKPERLNIRMDRENGELWLVDEPRWNPVRRIKNVTSNVLLALCADLVSVDGTERTEREVLFSEKNGKRWDARIIVEAFEVETGGDK